jgi:hypothetical protein
MKLLYYNAAKGEDGPGLKDLFELYFPDEDIEVYKSIEGLAKGLRRPMDGKAVGIFRVSDIHEISYLHHMRTLLNKLNLILVLPNPDPDMVANAHKLRPRYMTYYNSDPSDLRAVIRKIGRP